MNWWFVQEFWWLTIGSLFLLVDVFLKKNNSLQTVGRFSLALMIGAFFALFLPSAQGTAFSGSYVSNSASLVFKAVCVLAGIVSTWIALRENSSATFGVRESVSLPWFVIAGMGLMVSAGDFLLLFVSVELVTITFYVLVSLRRKESASLEAGLKYLVTGGLSTGFLVFGLALIFGVVGSLSYSEVRLAWAETIDGADKNPVFWAGVFFILAGLFFKVSVFPFHWWSPDVYQGAPKSATAFLAVGSKTAGFGVLTILISPQGPLELVVKEYGALLAWLAVFSIIFGSTGGLAQREISRLVAYSGVANAGFILLSLSVGSQTAFNAAIFYIVTYGLAGLLLMLVIGHLSIQTQKSQIGLNDISGLISVNPTLGWVCALAAASLAGIPPLAGFWAKWFVLSAAWADGLYLQVVVAVLGAVASLVYYLGLIRAIFFEPSSEMLTGGARIAMPLGYRLCVSVILAMMLVVGFTPNFLVKLTAVFS